MIGNGLTYGAFGWFSSSILGVLHKVLLVLLGLSAEQGPQKFIMQPNQVQGRLPMPISVSFSPFVKFDKVNKKFDMYCIDRSSVGVIAEKEALSTDNWTDPERDISVS